MLILSIFIICVGRNGVLLSYINLYVSSFIFKYKCGKCSLTCLWLLAHIVLFKSKYLLT